MDVALGYAIVQSFFTIPYVCICCYVLKQNYFSVHMTVMIVSILVTIFCYCNKFSMLKIRKNSVRLAPIIITGVMNLMFMNVLSVISGIVTIGTALLPVVLDFIYTNRKYCSMNLYGRHKHPLKKAFLYIGRDMDSYAILYNMFFATTTISSFCFCFTIFYFIAYVNCHNDGFLSIKVIFMIMCVVMCILTILILNTVHTINKS